MNAPAMASDLTDVYDLLQAQGLALGDLADAYGLLLEQDRALEGLDAVLQTLSAQPGERPLKGLLSAAQTLAAAALERCRFAQGEIESLARARRGGAA